MIKTFLFGLLKNIFFIRTLTSSRPRVDLVSLKFPSWMICAGTLAAHSFPRTLAIFGNSRDVMGTLAADIGNISDLRLAKNALSREL